MTRNQIKLLACLTMTVDHVGVVLFPQLFTLRLIGRTAMPLFAFFIGEGCFYTKDRKKYFLRLFVLALICQAVNIAESFITGSGNGFYLNILFTFSFSILLCGSFLEMKKAPGVKTGMIFFGILAVLFSLCLFFENSLTLTGTKITLDYGFPGIVLPLFAAVSMDRKKKLIIYSLGLVAFSVLCYGAFTPSFFWALLSLPFLFAYNGDAGKKKLKYFFYLFYPLHLAAIYAIGMII